MPVQSDKGVFRGPSLLCITVQSGGKFVVGRFFFLGLALFVFFFRCASGFFIDFQGIFKETRIFS